MSPSPSFGERCSSCRGLFTEAERRGFDVKAVGDDRYGEKAGLLADESTPGFTPTPPR